jgi:hypothetical protein
MKFNDLLTELFEQVEDDFETALVARYRLMAKAQHESWLKRLEGPEPPLGGFQSPYGLRNRPQYVTWEGNRNSNCLYYEPTIWGIKAAHTHQYGIDYETAERDARMQVKLAKRNFVAKQSAKLENACGDRAVKVEGKLSLETDIITGALFVADEPDSFRLEMTIKQNCSSLGKWFWQFPARFLSVCLGGEHHKSKSEKWMKENFAAAERDTK